MILVRPIVRKLLFAAALATALPASAATIFGTLKRGNQPLGGAAVQLTCGRQQSSGQSDPRGNYSLSISESGRCTLSVDNKTAPVNLGSQPVRYDFAVPATGTTLLQN